MDVAVGTADKKLPRKLGNLAKNKTVLCFEWRMWACPTYIECNGIPMRVDGSQPSNTTQKQVEKGRKRKAAELQQVTEEHL